MMKRYWQSFMLVCAFFMLFIINVKADAATSVMGQGDSATCAMKSDSASTAKAISGEIKIKTPGLSTEAYSAGNITIAGFKFSTGQSWYTVRRQNNAYGAQVQLLSYTNQPLASFNGIFSGSSNTFVLSKGVKAQRYFYYRVRAIYKNTDGSGYYYGVWSAKKAFATFTAGISTNNKKYRATLTMPSLSGVSKFEVWVSAKSSTSGYKNVVKVKPGKRIVISSVNGKTLKAYGTNHKFYIYIRPILKSGVTVTWLPYCYGYFYFYYK